jgi:hypothetical protein
LLFWRINFACFDDVTRVPANFLVGRRDSSEGAFVGSGHDGPTHNVVAACDDLLNLDVKIWKRLEHRGHHLPRPIASMNLTERF